MKIEITEAEFYDRLLILINKVYCCDKTQDIRASVQQLIHLCCSEGYRGYPSERIKDLRDANIDLWNLEEEVRGEPDDERRLLLSDQIREKNRLRSLAKRQIYTDGGGSNGGSEVKDYGDGKKY